MRCILLQKICPEMRIWSNIRLSGNIVLKGLLLMSVISMPIHADEVLTGQSIMDEVFKRHELYPYVFEEQTMVLMDNSDNRDVRKLRRFSRVEKDGTVKFLLVFDNPAEVRGVALLAIRQHSCNVQGGIYLPAFGKELKSGSGYNSGSPFLGTDFAIEDITVEILSDFRYERVADIKINKVDYFVVEAFPRNDEIEQNSGYGMRKHYIRQDNLFIVRIDYFDLHSRFFKRQTYHDLKRMDGDMWRANMILMENYKMKHKTLIKINRRVFSRDYVPKEMFTSDWLLENRHIQDTEMHFFQNISEPVGKSYGKIKDVP